MLRLLKIALTLSDASMCIAFGFLLFIYSIAQVLPKIKDARSNFIPPQAKNRAAQKLHRPDYRKSPSKSSKFSIFILPSNPGSFQRSPRLLSTLTRRHISDRIRPSITAAMKNIKIPFAKESK